MTMPNDWVDICIQERLDAGELLSRLDDAAVQGAWEDEGVVHLYWAEDQWNEEKLALGTVGSCRSGAVEQGDPSLGARECPSQDWNEAWTRSVKPLRIGRLVIRPSWEPVAVRSTRHRDRAGSEASLRHRPPCDDAYVAGVAARGYSRWRTGLGCGDWERDLGDGCGQAGRSLRHWSRD